MAKYRVTSPEGVTFEVTAPDDATPDQVQAYAQENMPKAAAQAKPAASWSDLPGNIGPSAARFVGGVAQAAMNPIDTVRSALDAGAGALRNAMPAGVRAAVDSVDTPENQAAGQRASDVASSVGQFYKKRYGGLDRIKETLVTDPVGAAADVSTLLAGGAGAARGAGMARAGNALTAASNATNPLSVVAPVARGVGKVAGGAAKNVLGMTTGVGAENVAQAARAGVKGDKDFLGNATGQVPLTDVLDKAKRGLDAMRQQKSADYRQNMAAVSADKSVLDFGGIDKALTDAAGLASFKGQVKNTKAAGAIQQMADDVAQWKALDPAEFHTPEGLDALKQRLGATLESIPFEEKTARLAAGRVYNAVKDEIAKQAPTYAGTMKGYAEASEQINEIERALSLGDRAAKDTAMRKLQSLARNNVQTNYGNRLDLARVLEDQGGVSLLPAIAGQAMNTWTPRSLTGQLGGSATLGFSLANPYALALLPMQSPKAVGLAAYGGGRAAGATGNAISRLGVTPQRAARAGLTAQQLANLSREEK